MTEFDKLKAAANAAVEKNEEEHRNSAYMSLYVQASQRTYVPLATKFLAAADNHQTGDIVLAAIEVIGQMVLTAPNPPATAKAVHQILETAVQCGLDRKNAR